MAHLFPGVTTQIMDTIDMGQLLAMFKFAEARR